MVAFVGAVAALAFFGAIFDLYGGITWRERTLAPFDLLAAGVVWLGVLGWSLLLLLRWGGVA